ncbi:MAG: helix-turn-helix transcriptional regulator [Actinomycetota bacterium]
MRGQAQVERARRNHRLIDARVAKGWSQPKLAHRAKCAIGTINQAETGRRVPIELTQERIARALGVERAWLFADEAYEEAS